MLQPFLKPLILAGISGLELAAKTVVDRRHSFFRSRRDRARDQRSVESPAGLPGAAADFQGTGPDRQMRERYAHTQSLALAVDPPGAESYRHSNRLDGNTIDQLVEKTLPALAAFG